jgi:hypothetical protein
MGVYRANVTWPAFRPAGTEVPSPTLRTHYEQHFTKASLKAEFTAHTSSDFHCENWIPKHSTAEEVLRTMATWIA